MPVARIIATMARLGFQSTGARLFGFAAIAALLFVGGAASRAAAQTVPEQASPGQQVFSEADVPPALRPWIPWALDGASRTCARLDVPAAAGQVGQVGQASRSVCAWPGMLRLRVDARGGSFVLDVSSDARVRQGLPGAGRAWPSGVRVDGRPSAVLDVLGTPSVALEPGVHRVEGSFAWASVPDTLRVPDDIARIVLERDGASALVSRGSAGEVWLGRGDGAASDAEEVTLEVHRRLADGSPIEVTTRVAIRASGRRRELRLGRVLPEGLVPVEVSGDLPARLSANGELAIQLAPGTFEVTVRAFAASSMSAFQKPALAAPWPEQEVWVWVPNEAFRQVELSGPLGVDPQRTSLPAEWRTNSAYLMDPGTTLTLTAVRRGEPSPPPNRVSIDRDVWLGFDGSAYWARDTIQASLRSSHRLTLEEGELGRVGFDGEDQLITIDDEGRPGIELRDSERTLTAEWRLAREGRRLPAVNWSEGASSDEMTLHLPPGWQLLHAGGVDRADGAWIERWSLLDVFALLLIGLAFGRVFGWRFAPIALVGVGLSYFEADAPRWFFFVLAALLGLHRAIGARPFERFVRFAYAAVMVVLTLVVVWFAAAELRQALYPQLAPPDESIAASLAFGGGTIDGRSMTFDEGGGGFDALAEGIASPMRSSRTEYLSELEPPAERWSDPNAIVQTGFGIPEWMWSRYRLAFDGPVARGHEISLTLLPPWASRLASLLRAILMLALLALVVTLRPRRQEPTPSDDGGASPEGEEEPTPPAPPEPDATPEPGSAGPTAATEATGSTASTLGALALIALVSSTVWFGASPARAQDVPPDTTLSALRERLLRRAPCGDRCGEVDRMELRAEGDTLRVRMEVSAADIVAYPLPGPTDVWVPSVVRVDGAETRALVRLEGGFLFVRVPAGAHVVELEGSLASRDSMNLALGHPPHALDVVTDGWESFGNRAEARVEDSIELRRVAARTAAGSAVGSDDAVDEATTELPVWIEVERRLDVGVRWTSTTTVRRRSPATSSSVARVRLLPGERVTDSSVTVEEGQALVTLGQGVNEVRFTSTLEPRDALTLTAPAEGARNEVWILACSPLWSCEVPPPEPLGLAPTRQSEGTAWRPTYHPWPGESLTIHFARPTAMEGQSLTIDHVDLRVTPGTRATENALTFSVRSSVTRTLSIELPEGATVQSLVVNQEARPIQRDGTRVSIALQPGRHQVQLDWREDAGIAAIFETPRVSFDHPAANVSVDVLLPSNRWVLWLSGPVWGPAVLFWPYLALLVVLALALSRRKELPLRVYDWALLLLGLTQIPAIAAALVVLWFFLLEHRRTQLELSPLTFAARQLFILGFTLVAFGCLIAAIVTGLLGVPEMQLAGPGSSASLAHHYVDRIDGALPVARVVSVSIWFYRLFMFAWALWLVVRLIGWARWGFRAFREGGFFLSFGLMKKR